MLIKTVLLILLTGVVWLLMRYSKHRGKKVLRRNRETWAIGLYEGNSPLDLFPSSNIKNPVLTASNVTDINARFVADPFMIEHDNQYYLFFEVLNNKRNTGEIAYASSNNGLQWEYGKVVLRERFHLSYPYVFTLEEQIYMIPECIGSKGIQLYQATQFPEQWKHMATIIKGHDRFAALADPSIIHHQNRWYLFSYAGKSKNLHLFSSEQLTGPWTEHPKSPVCCNSPHFSRPGGRIIMHEGTLYRYAQDEIPLYGSRVWAFRITELTANTYYEERASEQPVVQPGHEWWNKDGMHTVDLHKTQEGRWMAFVDGFTVHHS